MTEAMTRESSRAHDRCGPGPEATEGRGTGNLLELLRPVLQALAATAKLGWDPSPHNPKLLRRLGRVRAPTLVVHGVSDGIVPRAHAEAYAAGIPEARLVDVEGAAHLLSLERPAELAALVRGHLAGVAP
jgi:pimeloyl-ACP methyl ester carboxylesterase